MRETCAVKQSFSALVPRACTLANVITPLHQKINNRTAALAVLFIFFTALSCNTHTINNFYQIQKINQKRRRKRRRKEILIRMQMTHRTVLCVKEKAKL